MRSFVEQNHVSVAFAPLRQLKELGYLPWRFVLVCVFHHEQMVPDVAFCKKHRVDLQTCLNVGTLSARLSAVDITLNQI